MSSKPSPMTPPCHSNSKVSFQNKIMIAFNVILSGSIVPPLIKVFLVWFSILARLTILTVVLMHIVPSYHSYLQQNSFPGQAAHGTSFLPRNVQVVERYINLSDDQYLGQLFDSC